MKDSIFTRIIKGEIPAYKIYEDEHSLALLDIHPFNPGHVLVVSKKQVDKLWELPEADYNAIQATVKKVARRIDKVLKPVRVGIKVIGIDVPHAHVHVFPFSDMADYNKSADMNAEPDHRELAAMAKKLAFK